MRKNHPLYCTWMTMLHRCENPKREKYPRYGGRGIVVCPQWSDRAAGLACFASDMGPKPTPKHTLDRVDNDGPYSPENCRWATPTQQARNTSTNAMVSTAGGDLVLAEAADALGIARSTLYARRGRGHDLLGAVNKKPRATITAEQAREIRRLSAEGATRAEITARIGTTPWVVKNVLIGATWRDVA